MSDEAIVLPLPGATKTHCHKCSFREGAWQGTHIHQRCSIFGSVLETEPQVVFEDVEYKRLPQCLAKVPQ